MAMTTAEVRRLLCTELAVSPEVAAIALGVGKVAVDGAISRGAIPAVNLREGARKRPISMAWL
jgi:hypothetical protein